MAETVYTFPDQELLSGTWSVIITTSHGDGTPVTVTKKYFSGKPVISDETEFEGGDLQSKYADIIIDYDYDNLFAETIFSSLYQDDGYVKIKILQNGKRRFYGVIEPATISQEYFHADNDTLDNIKRSITFRCIWVLSLLKRIKREALILKIIALRSTLLTRLPWHGTTLDEESITIAGITKACLSCLEDSYTVTTSISYDPVNIRFFSKPASDKSTSYTYPNSQEGFTAPQFYISPYDLHLLFYNYASQKNIGLFSETDGLETAYDYFVQVLKSFGLIATIKDSEDFDFSVSIGSRVTGNPVTIRNIVSMNDTLPGELSRNKIDVSSTVSGNQFKKNLNGSASGSSFSENVSYDFGNSEFDGATNNTTAQLSLMFPTLKPFGSDRYYVLMRECGFGENGLTNPRFATDLSGWTVSSGAWAWSGANKFNYPGCALLTLNGGGVASGYIMQSFTMDPNDFYIFSCYITGSGAFGGIPSTTTVTMKIYDSSGRLVAQSSVAGGSTDYILRCNVTFKGQKPTTREYGTANTVVINIEDSQGVGSVSLPIYVGETSIYRCRTGSPEIVGKTVADYFDSNLITRKSIVASGILDDVQLRDFTYFGNQKFYIKKLTYNPVDNETEIEAINYPY